MAENGSDSVMNFISSGSANGAIGYDEYSYALGKNYPVAKILNSGGYYTLPNQYNVAVALTKAVINSDPSSQDYLLQNLDNVYTYSDPRVYPMSSYSYMIIPTSSTDKTMTTAKRQTLADYLYYSICQGQKEMGPIGYSPLPINLVQASFNQTAQLHTADPNVDLTSESVATCNNPTFVAGQPSRNYLAEIAPQPAGCDKQGAGPCGTSVDVGLSNPIGGRAPSPTSGASAGSNGGSTGATGSGAGAGSGTGRGSSGTGATGGATGSGKAATNTATGTHIDPATGQLVIGGSGPDQASSDVVGNPTVLAASQSHSVNVGIGALAVLLLLAALLAPPLAAIQFRKKQ